MKLLVTDAVRGGVLDGRGEEVHLFERCENVRAHSDAGEFAVHVALSSGRRRCEKSTSVHEDLQDAHSLG